MKTLLIMLAYTNVFGSAPICSFDGYVFSCYYYTWSQCEAAAPSNARCVLHP